MRNTRIYIDKPLSINEKVVLPKNAAHHLLRVLRCRVGDNVTLFNGNGGCYQGSLVHASKQSAEVKIIRFVEDKAGQILEIILALGISRNLKMDFAVQKAVESGASKIIPLFTERSHVKLKKERIQSRLDHWTKVIIHACEQSGRNTMPVLASPENINDWLQSDHIGMKLLLSTGTDKTISSIREKAEQRITLLIGPESGLDMKEHALAISRGFLPIKLGPRTMRTETAVVVSIAACQTLWGDFR